MEQFTLAGSHFLYPTPGGAFYAVAGSEDNPSRRLLRTLLQQEVSPPLNLAELIRWTGSSNEQKLLTLIHRMQTAGWLQGVDEPLHAPVQAVEKLFPVLLGSLCTGGKALLADNHGFYLASHGFPHEVAEELSALSAELTSLYERRAGLLDNNLGLGSSAWGLIDAAGNSRIGFWPLYISTKRFVLVISGVPTLNHPDLVRLIWVLMRRYSTTA